MRLWKRICWGAVALLAIVLGAVNSPGQTRPALPDALATASQPATLPDLKGITGEARKALIVDLMKRLEKDAKTKEEIQAKAEAIEALDVLKAVEAADILAQQIVFYHPEEPTGPKIGGRPRDTFLRVKDYYPAYAALVDIGKPGTPSVLRTLRKIEPPADGNWSRDVIVRMRVVLLAQVLLEVEGSDSGQNLLQGEIDGATSERQKQVFQQALLSMQMAETRREAATKPRGTE